MIAINRGNSADRTKERGNKPQNPAPLSPFLTLFLIISQLWLFVEAQDMNNSPFICTRENEHAPSISDEAQRYYQEAAKLEAIHKPDQYAVNRLYNKAMEEGHWVAQYNLGVRYMKGRGLEARDNLRAIALFEDLIQREIPLGMYAMAMMFRDGIGVASNQTKASQYMHLAADKGNPQAQFYLGQLADRRYEYALAKQYYRCAAAQKHKEAYERLASHALHSEENYPKAVRYYMEAAKLGYSRIILRLAGIFKEGSTDNEWFGYAPDAALSACFMAKRDAWGKDKSLTFPHLDQECPLPLHPVMGDGSEYPDLEIREPRFLERLQEAPHNPEKEEEMGRERMRWLREEHRYILENLYGDHF